MMLIFECTNDEQMRRFRGFYSTMNWVTDRPEHVQLHFLSHPVLSFIHHPLGEYAMANPYSKMTPSLFKGLNVYVTGLTNTERANSPSTSHQII